MCGICGYYGVADADAINRMTSTLYSRGPDDGGIFIHKADKVAFGHRRLSILDLSSAGHQPMKNLDGSIVITYNGEVYNFPELREKLAAEGRVFQSRTDTEVILACYEKYGIGMTSLLDGIFAFALYDSKKRKLYLVRDQLGVKPLYYSFTGGRLIFGSEIKAVLASNLITPEINRQALWDYLTYMYVPCPLTMYSGVFQVPPAHFLALDLDTKEYHIERYWNPLDNVGERITDPEEVYRSVRETLSQTVKEQLVSDVPISAFLSGGIDSNIVVGLMARHSGQRVRTFTAVFNGKNASYFNEKEAAGRIARKFNTLHEEIDIPVPKLDDIVSMLSWTDQPFGNPALFLSYLISKEIKRHVSVALSGAGGDELFGGYIRYKHFATARKIVKISPVNLSALAKQMTKIWPATFKPQLWTRFYKFFNGLQPDIVRHYLRWTYFIEDGDKAEFFKDAGAFLPSQRVLEELFREGGVLGEMLNILGYVDLFSYLRDDILEYTDKSSMAASLEVRVPFLSPKMIQLSLRIPDKLKISGGMTKVALKKAFKDLIPEENLKAPKKGFSAPVSIWAQEIDAYMKEIERKLPPECPINFKKIQEMRDLHKSGRFNYGQILFGILMLEVWMADTIYK